MYPTIRFDVSDECDPLGVGLGAPETSVLIERTVVCGGAPEHAVWVFGARGDAVGQRLRDADPIDEATALPTVDGPTESRCFRIRWDGPPPGVFVPLRSAGATLLEAVRSDGRWQFAARIPTEGLGRFQTECRERGLRTEIRAIDRGPVRRHDDGDDVRSRLTGAQSEALALALERGYFEVPRQTSLEDLAAELGVSDSAASQRLRRGLAALLRATMGAGAGRGRVSAD